MERRVLSPSFCRSCAVPLAGGVGEAVRNPVRAVQRADVPPAAPSSGGRQAPPAAVHAARGDAAAADSNPAPPAEAPLVGDASERDDSRRDARRDRGVHQPRRPPQELAAEALSRSPEASRWSWSSNDLPSQPLPFSLARRRIDASTRTLNSALYAVSDAAAGAISRDVADAAAVRILATRHGLHVDQGIRRSTRRLHRDRQATVTPATAGELPSRFDWGAGARRQRREAAATR